MIKIMTPDHLRWDEFCNRLAGPEGCNFHDETWTCDSRDHSKPFCRKILEDMGFADQEIAATLEFFDEHGGYCDCEVLFNVDRSEEEEIDVNLN
jgi:hypothetical protein